jgi:hypothetical protein
MSVGAAGDRVAELLDRWMAGVEMHARYLALDDAAYASAQDWPRHQRPTRWIVELARSRCVELKRQLGERQARGDDGFADALELMAFLTNLLGSEHVERFIPLPDPSGAKRPRPAETPLAALPAAAPPAAATHTAESPPAKAPAARSSPAARAAPRAKAGTGTRGTARAPASARTARAAQPAAAATAGPSGGSDTRNDARSATVIADAVRLLNWGRPWPELASLIARLADRPAEAEVWEILRRHRAEIEAQARPPVE